MQSISPSSPPPPNLLTNFFVYICENHSCIIFLCIPQPNVSQEKMNFNQRCFLRWLMLQYNSHRERGGEKTWISPHLALSIWINWMSRSPFQCNSVLGEWKGKRGWNLARLRCFCCTKLQRVLCVIKREWYISLERIFHFRLSEVVLISQQEQVAPESGTLWINIMGAFSVEGMFGLKSSI